MLGKKFDNAGDDLSLAWQAECGEKRTEGLVDGFCAEIKTFYVRFQDADIGCGTNVLANLGLAEARVGPEEFCHLRRVLMMICTSATCFAYLDGINRVRKESLLLQKCNTLLGTLVKALAACSSIIESTELTKQYNFGRDLRKARA